MYLHNKNWCCVGSCVYRSSAVIRLLFILCITNNKWCPVKVWNSNAQQQKVCVNTIITQTMEGTIDKLLNFHCVGLIPSAQMCVRVQIRPFI